MTNKQNLSIHKVFLGLGSNVGDRKKNLALAEILLRKQLTQLTVAKVYESKPVGFKEQSNFFNTAVSAYTNFTPLKLLKFIKDIEKKVGRVKRFRFGPREIDIDILFYGDFLYKDAQLEIPHPRLWERDFVLKPLIDLDPQLIHPKLKKSVTELYSQIKQEDLSIIM